MQFWLGAFAFYILGTGSGDGMKFFAMIVLKSRNKDEI